MDGILSTQKALQNAIKTANMKEFMHHLSFIKNVNQNHQRSKLFITTAIAAGRKEMVEALLDRGANSRAINPNGHKAIHVAAEHGQIEILDLLLRRGEGDLTTRTDIGDTCLYVAVDNKQAGTVKYLLDHGDSVDETVSSIYLHNTALHKAASQEDPTILNLLLAAGAQVDKLNDVRQTALHIAAEDGRAACVERLIQCGASVHLVDNNGNSPLQLACDNGHGSAARHLLLAGASITSQNSADEECFQNAVLRRFVPVVRLLLQYGADVNRVFASSRTALHTALENCPHSMVSNWRPSNGIKLTTNNEIEMFDVLLQAGADLEVKDRAGETPLHMCVRHGCAATLHYFLRAGANTNTMNSVGESPLVTACRANTTPAIQLLIQNSPDLLNHPVNHADKDKSPLLILSAKGNTDCLRLLFAAGYRVSSMERNELQMRTINVNDGNSVPRGRGRGRGRGRRQQGGRMNSGGVKNIKVIDELIEQELENPWALEKACRIAVRELLCSSLAKKVMSLPLPMKMRQSLLLKNVL